MGQIARLPTAHERCQRGILPAGAALALPVIAAALVAGLGRLDAAGPSPAFVDMADRWHVGFVHAASPTREKYLLETMGSGVAVFDADGDGRLDLYFVNGAALQDPMPSGAGPDKQLPRYANRFYRQRPDGTFEDDTESAGLTGSGYGMGVAVGDYDNDGHEDLYVTAWEGNRLYHNRGDGTFEDVTARAGVAGGGWSTSAAFVDVDEDGRLDLLVARYLTWSFATNGYCGEHREGYRAYCHPDQYPGITSLLFHNDGGGRFTEIGAKAGIADPGGKSLGTAIADFDRDGHVDLFGNRGNGTFEDVALASGAAFDQDGHVFAGMGVSFADQDNDGYPDLLVTTLSNQLYACFRNDGHGGFRYATYTTGLADLTRLSSGWGLALADFDNDGERDLLVGQGHVLDTIELTSPHISYRQPLLLARGRSGRYENVSAGAGPAFAVPLASRGLATGDLDGDGRLDAVVTTLDGRALVLRNTTTAAGHWLGVRLTGTRSNRDGLGASIELATPDGRRQYATVTTTGSYLSASDRTVHFGLGGAMSGRLTIRWPGGGMQTVDAAAVDRVIHVTQP
jgi:hypothetical protein